MWCLSGGFGSLGLGFRRHGDRGFRRHTVLVVVPVDFATAATSATATAPDVLVTAIVLGLCRRKAREGLFREGREPSNWIMSD